MSDPVVIIAMVLLAALVELSPRRIVPFGALLAVGVVLVDAKDGGVLVMALAGAGGIALASLGIALEARRTRDRRGASPMAMAQREALRARLSSSRTFARLAFVMAALPGPMSKILYPLLGAMRAPLVPSLVGTIVGRTITLTITTGLFTIVARGLSTDDSGAAEFLVTGIVLVVLVRLVNWIDWDYRGKHGTWRLRESGADPFSARMFTTGAGAAGDGSGFPGAFPGAGAADDDRSDEDVLEGDVIGEEILDDDDAAADRDQGSRGELPSGS